ncbi:helix-turn-helix DNA binding domain protein [Streptomyces phage Gilgamesh]|uniref:Helix-turn-helix DNA binding domain protein n=1 Tax=Streptomyces phage Gilgamesh TaxID=2599890 RepID=A0A5J6TTS9_9CAUD|nr:helix-turn-helix DNA binding domain protein [Streptomyces phage Gilgamesh]QFG13279.1 helix-turn-helix DNA binding domain protein [Streptomyces phage Gilgamesh]
MTEHTDPPGMPEDERMTPAELRVVREYLGVTPEWLAAHLKVSGRLVRHWEQGKYAIPDIHRLEIQNLERYTGAFVSKVIDHLMDVPEPVVGTYRDDDEYHAAHPEMSFPASWHRAVIARVAQEIPALSIVYAVDVVD